MKKIRTNIFTATKNGEVVYLPDMVISIQGHLIQAIESGAEAVGDIEDCRTLLCIPGLVDTHVHLSQWFARARYRPHLLEWLDQEIFPEEAKARDRLYAVRTANAFFQGMLKSGTTSAMVYTALYPTSCDAAFEAAESNGVRVRMGKTMMDWNTPSILSETTEDSWQSSLRLYEKWHKKTDLLEYVFTPRFAPLCSRKLMQQIGEFSRSEKAWIQTHLSENKSELEWVRELYPECSSYTDVYRHYGLLSERTIMGHSIHLENEELKMLHDTGTKIAHCPDSNFFLRSGEFPLDRVEEYGVPYALASDVGAGTTLSMFHHMMMMGYRQSQATVNPEKSFIKATLDGAIIMGWQDKIGSIEVGKEADLVFIPIENPQLDAKAIAARLVYQGRDIPVQRVMIAGKEVYTIGRA